VTKSNGVRFTSENELIHDPDGDFYSFLSAALQLLHVS